MTKTTRIFGANSVKAKRQKQPGRWEKNRLAHFLRLPLYFLMALLCILGSPVLAKVPNSINPSLQLPINSQTSLAVVTDPASLLQQGKILYDTGNFAKAVEVLEQAVQAYRQD